MGTERGGVELTSHGSTGPGTTRSPVPRSAMVPEVVALLVSVGWALTHRGALASVQHRLGGMAVVGALLLVCGVCYVGGFVLLAAGFGGPFVALRRSPALPPSQAGGIRDVVARAIDEAPTSLSFRTGWWLTSIGAVAPGVILAVGVLVGLPGEDRPLATLPAVDALVSIVLRSVVAVRFRRRRLARDRALAGTPIDLGAALTAPARP